MGAGVGGGPGPGRVRDHDVADRELAARYLQVAAEFAEPIHDARAGEIVRRRTATALSIVKSERSLPEEP